jgi:acetyl esterase/lipase
MNKVTYLIIFAVLLFTACSKDESTDAVIVDGTPIVKAESFYTVLTDEDITYAEGLSHNASSTTPFSIPLKLDIYTPDNNSENRPVFMFIHGGGFRGGTKTKPEIVEMANYYASRGWVFASIDYRTAEELGIIQGMTQDELLTYYTGIAPQEWVENALQGAQNSDEVQQATAMYLAQRDAKAALRWIVANSNTYNINTDFITVGGASAGAITTIALGISNQEDFRDEISVTDDPTLSTTNLNESYAVRSMVYFWGSNIKLDVFEAVYELNQYDRYDSSDPELFMGHGTAEDPVTPYEEALELQGIYDSLGIYNKLVTLLKPNGDPIGHGAWNAIVDGKSLSELTFDFLVERQQLIVE